MVRVAALMLGVILVAVVRGGGEIDPSDVLTWMFALGFVLVSAACAWMLRRIAGATTVVR